MKRRAFPPRRQRGFSLVTGMILLVVMLLLGVVAMKNARIEERMAGGAMDQNVAFQAAENAMREAENVVYTSLTSTSGFAADCTGGLCLPSTTSTPIWESVDWTGNKPMVYPTQAGTPAIPDVTQQPRYIIELMSPDVREILGDSVVDSDKNGATTYRITAIGYGKQPGTQVMLQSVFVKQ